MISQRIIITFVRRRYLDVALDFFPLDSNFVDFISGWFVGQFESRFGSRVRREFDVTGKIVADGRRNRQPKIAEILMECWQNGLIERGVGTVTSVIDLVRPILQERENSKNRNVCHDMTIRTGILTYKTENKINDLRVSTKGEKLIIKDSKN